MAASLPTPFSYQQYDGDGSKADFTFSFDYLLREHVKVYLDDAEVTEGTGASEWQWDGDKKILMGTAPTVGQTLTIRRETPEDKQQVQWNDGSYLVAEDLNTSDLQWLYLIQEHHDMLMRIVWGLEPIPGPGLPDDLYSFWNRLARNKDSNKGTADEKAQTIDKTDQLKGDAVPGSVQNGEDAYVLTLGAISERLDLVKGDGSSYPGTGNTGQLGKLRVNSSNKLFFWDQTLATPAWVEIIGGSAGPPGAAATIAVGTTTTLDAGNPATVSNSGTSSAAVFDFGIPKGPKGDPGTAGAGATVAAGTTTTLAAGSSATVTNSGTSTAAVFDFGIPKGDKGDPGSAGTPGAAATIAVGTTTTLPAGSSATVTNTGSSSAATFNFGIPKGADGSGAGTVTEVKQGNGITVTDGTSEPVVTAKSGDNSIVVDSAGIKVKVKSGGGITVDADGLSAAGGTAPGDGQINVNAGNGLEASGDNATANQAGNTTRTLTAKAGDNTITVDGDGIKVNTANLPTVTPGDGQINVAAGNGLEASGDNATANQTGNTTRTLTAKAGDNTITVDAAGIKVNTANLPAQVQSDWTEANTSSAAFIKNKPTITSSPWTRDGTNIKPATATDSVETTAALKTKQVYADAVTLSGATVTPDFKDGNCFILSGAITTVNAPVSGTLKVGQSGKFYFLSGATVAGWNTNYKWPGGTKALSPTGVTIVPFYVATASTILMGASTEDIK